MDVKNEILIFVMLTLITIWICVWISLTGAPDGLYYGVILSFMSGVVGKILWICHKYELEEKMLKAEIDELYKGE